MKNLNGDKELENLLNIVLVKFPELKKYKFSIKYNILSDSFAEITIWLYGKKVHIDIDEDLKNQKEILKLAVIASELSHLIKEEMLSIIPLGICNFIEGLIYERSKIYRRYDEKQTDIETIRRGFGKELLELRKYDEGYIDGHIDGQYSLDDDYSREGLSIAELEAIIFRTT